jgi:hypothetical protein
VLSTVKILMGAAQHVAPVGAHIGEIAMGQCLDFIDDPVVFQALGEAASGVVEERGNHGVLPFDAVY